jgi:hypothetical protein
VKVFIIGLLILLAFVFVIENIEVLKHAVQLRLNLYFVDLHSTPLDLWVLMLMSFTLGAVLVFIYFIYDHIRQRQIIRHLRQNVEILAMELKRAGVAMEGTSRSDNSSNPVLKN